MHEIPECLNRRYRALDELIRELSSAMSPRASVTECPGCPSEPDNAGIRLMCDFWNILQENPDCNLPLEVQQRMNLVPKQSRVFRPQHITCYMAGKSSSSEADDKKKITIKSACCHSRTPPETKQKTSCCASKSVTPTSSEAMPLSKVLCNLKEAASFEKKCTAKVSKLMETQNELQKQIQVLEDREKEGVQLLKQADCMWSCMEDSYKTKVAESLDRQKILVNQMKEVEASATKWRKNKKDLEFQLVNVSKCHEEIKEKLGQKTNDMKIMDMEMDDLKKRLLYSKNDTENSKNSLNTKRTSCDAKVAKIMQDISRLQKDIAEEGKRKSDKEKEGGGYVKEAREDLQKMCKVLLRKKLENEDLLAEKDALLEEIEIIHQTCDHCKDKCSNKQTTINDELKKINSEIANYKVRCIRCHQCTDTADVRKLCTDCPRCLEQRECLYEDDHCTVDPTMDCVCISIKQKFLDNVFDNMYTILERQARTGPGKAVAEAVLNCLKRSRNGKLDDETKKILQEFILTTVKKNLNLTIVGGAVKTRCEMDSETYKQLMLCLKDVKTTQPPKEDKGTAVKKDPCFRWGGTSECNCPKGPKGCICTKKAPPPPRDPTPCPPPDKEDADAGQLTACPHKDNAACGPDCAMRAVPSAVGTDVAAWRPDPCKGQSCPFAKNMRAAQCMLGPESLSSLPKGRATAPYVPDVSAMDNTLTCNCGKAPAKPCPCREDTKHLKAELKKHLDKGTCINCQIDTVQCRVSHGTVIPDFTNDLGLSIEESKAKQVHANKPNKTYQSTTIEPKDNYKSTSEATNKINRKQVSDPGSIKIKVDVGIKTSQQENQFSELIKTLSGTLAMELDGRVVEDIEKKINEDPHLFLSLKETDSGHNLIYFDTNNKSTTNQRVMIRKTSSGNRFFEIRKSIIRILKPDAVKEQNKTWLELKSPSNDFAKLSKNANTNSLIIDTRSKYIDNASSIDTQSSKLMKNIEYQSEINQLYETGSRAIDIKIKRGDVVLDKEKVTIIKMSTGIVAVNLKNISSLTDLKFPKTISVLLKKSNSGTYLIDTNNSNQFPNAVLETTLSESILLKVTDTINKTAAPANISRNEQRLDEFFKVKVKCSTIDTTELPAVLKTSDSENYIIVLDKEFEKRYKQTIQDYIGDKTECYVDLNKSDSGSFVIKLYDTEDVSVEDANALLIKTPSGSIKVYVKGAIFDIMHKLPTKKSSIYSAKAFGELLNKLPPSSREFHREKLRKSKFIGSKSSSESNLFDSANRHDKDLFDKSTLELKKTDSGKYAVVLNKESKKKFIKNLKNYLSVNSQGLIPINRTDSGEITIVLNNTNQDNGLYGSLKITPSGNIYVLVDENVIKEIVKKDVTKTGSSSSNETGTSCVIGAIKRPVNKAVATTCNARPDDCSCDASKCVCKELQSDTTDWLYPHENHEHVVLPLLQNKNVNWFDVTNSVKVIPKNCSPDTCREIPLLNIYGIPKHESPHIVIKPSFPGPTLVNKFGSTEQCYYVIDTVPNEILDISGFCNDAQDNKVHSDEFKGAAEFHGARGREMDDSLDFLPPQLPSFLSNVNYR